MYKPLALLFPLLFCISLLSQAQVTGDTSVCAGEQVIYNVPVVSGASYSWSQTGGSFIGASNVDSALIQWGEPGVGTIIVTVNPPSGPAIYHTLNVTINPNPDPAITHPPYPSCPPDTGRQGGVGIPDESLVCEKVCDYATVTYSTPLNAGSSYLWAATGDLSITGATTNTVTVTWDSTGYGSLTVYETNSFGCTDSAVICVEKVDLPTAYFTNQASACRYTNVPFTNGSTGATSYSWFFGDGGTSADENPSHPYSSPGTYTITLVAQNECFCTDTFTNTITIDSLPGPDISCPSTVCAFDTAQYSASGDTSCTYNWFAIGGTITAGNGTHNITVVWGSGAIGTLGLYLSGCSGVCDDTTFINIPIVPATATISGVNKVCPGSCETYTLPHFSGAVYHWSLSGTCGQLADTTNCEEVIICWPDYLFSCDDTLNVSYYDSFLNCGGTGQFVIHLRPELQIFGSSPVCSNSLASFSSNVSCTWSVSPAGPTITGSPGTGITVDWNGIPGNYLVTAVPVTPSQVCTDSTTYLVQVVAPPPAPTLVGDTLVCPNSTHSYCAPGSGSNINWMITNGTPASATANCVTVNWGPSGPYIVQAFEQDADAPFCSSDTTTLNVSQATGSAPTLTGPLTACANSSSSFSTSTSYPAGTTFSWTISPTNAGSIASPGSPATTIEWGNNAPTTVTVTLTVDVCGSTYSNSTTINLDPVPTPTVNQLGTFCVGDSTQLQAVGGAFTAFSWSGPGAYTSTSNPTTIYAGGLYQVTVTDGNGCTALSQLNVSTVSGPNASISTADFTSFCTGTSFSVNICALENPNYSYNWSTGATTSCINTSVVGTFTVTVTDVATGCSAVSNSITVSQDTCTGGGGTGNGGCVSNSTISFTHSGCNPVIFTNTSVGGISYTWDFGDGNTSTSTSPSHSYTNAGFYLVVLTGTVVDTSGTDTCALVDTAHIEIPLVADFDLVTGCNGDSVCFTDMSSYTAGNSITSWRWNFGDGDTSNLQDPCHLYAASGTYLVTLTISNGSCFTSFTDTVVIGPSPTAYFGFSSPNCINTPVAFSDSSFSSINYWEWAFGDGGTSLNQNPSHNYSGPLTYPVSLIVHDIYGCADTTTDSVVIVSPTSYGPITAYPDTVVCQGTSVLLVAPACGGCSYLWSTGSVNDSITVTTTGIYTLTMDDGTGCPYSTFIRIIVNTGPPAIIKGAADICLGEFINLSSTYNPNWAYQWITTDTVNNGATTNSVSYTPVTAGAYTYQVIVTDTTTGCSDTSALTSITVFPGPVAPVISPVGPGVVCDGDTIVLAATHPDPTVTYQWSTGEVTDTILVTKNGCYKLTVTDTNGCTNTAGYCATVNPMPDLCSFYEGCYDTCKPYTIIGPWGGTSYQWLLNGSPILGATMKDYAATLSGLYSLIVTNSYGCTDTTGELDLSLYDCPADTFCADFLIDTVFCDGSNYIMQYHVVNNSGDSISQVNLEILPPFLSLPYAPYTSYIGLAAGDTSGPLTATIYGGTAGDDLCFRTHITAYDSLGNEVLCCYSDTVCVHLPACDTSCCYLNYLGDTVWCRQTPIGTKYFFDLTVDGCGILFVSSTNSGVLNVSSPYTLVSGPNTVSGSYIATSTDTVLCLHLVVPDNMQQICKDTTVCIPIECKEHPLPCDWDFEPTVCVGHSTNFLYYGSSTGLTIGWTFTGGVPGTASGLGPHSVSYPTPGTYPVTMTLTNASGTTTCEDSITVLPGPTASITQSGNTLNAAPAGMSYQWYNGSPWGLISGANNQYYLPGSAGYFCVVVTDPSGCADTACIQNEYVGIDDITLQGWSLYPNPNQGSFTLSLSMLAKGNVTLKVTNTLGEVIDQRTFEVQPGQHSFFIDNQRFATGVYFVQLQSKQGTYIKRMVVE